MRLVLALALCYLVGSIPTAVWVGKITRGIDVRQHGSGNAGATNALRVLGWKPGLLVMLLDMGKGFLAVLLFANIAIPHGTLLPDVVRVLAGSFAILGHVFPFTIGFRGGKGVGTAAGVMFALAPMVTVGAIILWIVIVSLTRFVSLGSMTAAISVPLFLLLGKLTLGREPGQALMIFGLILALAVLVSHHANIKRLMAGKENKLTIRRKPVQGGSS